ncbi:MAG: DUF1707 SHOCT-like domain-containing protein [Acidimicrobiales bacterium]
MDEQSVRRSIQPRGRGTRWGRESGYATGYAWWGSDPTASAGTREGRSGAPPEPDLRVSDDDRNSVAEDLSEHFEAGRLDMAEHQERITQALGARTRRDLAGLLSDLPPLRPSKHQPRPRREPAPWMVLPILFPIIVAVVVGNAVFGIRHGSFFPWFLIPIGIVVALRVRRRRWRSGFPTT